MDIKQNWNTNIEIQILYNITTTSNTYCTTATVGTAAAAGGKLSCCSYIFLLRWCPFALTFGCGTALCCNCRTTLLDDRCALSSFISRLTQRSLSCFSSPMIILPYCNLLRRFCSGMRTSEMTISFFFSQLAVVMDYYKRWL
jgi:hypothetical protein